MQNRFYLTILILFAVGLANVKADNHGAYSTYIPAGGTKIETVEISPDGMAQIAVDINMFSTLTKGVKVRLDIFLNGTLQYTRIRPYKPGQTIHHDIHINVPHLWSPESPTLYNAVYTLYEGKEIVGKTEETFGIRTAYVEPRRGFMLNGQIRMLQGVCLPTSFDTIGGVYHKEVITYWVKTLKDMGCNALRVDEGLLPLDLVEEADKQGLMLLVEPFNTDNPNADKVLTVRMYRNHPSVVLFTLGNLSSTACQNRDFKMLDTRLALLRKEAPSICVTMGVDQVDCTVQSSWADSLDIVGLNYSPFRYTEAKLKTPQHLALGIKASATDSEGMNLMTNEHWLIGEFVHAKDLINRALMVEPMFFQRRSVWNPLRPTLFFVSGWNHQIGDTVNVQVYTDQNDAELFLNETSLGHMKKNNHMIEWKNIPYQKGTLKAVSYFPDGKEACSAYLSTAESPVYAELVTESYENITIIHARLLDQHNSLCTNAEKELKIQVEGAGEVLSVMNADSTILRPTSPIRMQTKKGILTIVTEGKATISVTGDGLVGTKFSR